MNETHIPSFGPAWSINPYRGCEFGCSYCYARSTHDFLPHTNSGEFESRIFVKVDAASALDAQLRPGLLRGRPVVLGTATDPYQPAEHTFRITRRILERLRDCPGLRLSITTKSPLVLRDLDLLREIASRASVRVNVSLPTLLPDLSRILEGRAPGPRHRLEAIERLAGGGIETVVFVMPIMPGINDGERDLERLLRAAKSAGAAGAAASVLHLEGAARASFFSVLERAFPRLVPSYQASYRSGRLADPIVREGIQKRFALLRRRLGLEIAAEWPPVASALEPTPEPHPAPAQLSFCV